MPVHDCVQMMAGCKSMEAAKNLFSFENRCAHNHFIAVAPAKRYHTSHVTRHTSHVTRHTSHVTHHLVRHVSTRRVSPGYMGAEKRALNLRMEEEQSPPYSCV